MKLNSIILSVPRSLLRLPVKCEGVIGNLPGTLCLLPLGGTVERSSGSSVPWGWRGHEADGQLSGPYVWDVSWRSPPCRAISPITAVPRCLHFGRETSRGLLQFGGGKCRGRRFRGSRVGNKSCLLAELTPRPWLCLWLEASAPLCHWRGEEWVLRYSDFIAPT